MFGIGSRAQDLFEEDDLDTVVASSPPKKVEFSVHLEPAAPGRTRLLKDINTRPIKALPLRFKQLIFLTPSHESAPQIAAKMSLMKDFSR